MRRMHMHADRFVPYRITLGSASWTSEGNRYGPPPARVDEKMLTSKLRCGPLLGGDGSSAVSEDRSDNAIELTAAIAFKRRGAEAKLVLPGLGRRR